MSTIFQESKMNDEIITVIYAYDTVNGSVDMNEKHIPDELGQNNDFSIMLGDHPQFLQKLECPLLLIHVLLEIAVNFKDMVQVVILMDKNENHASVEKVNDIHRI